ncbi:bifunctional phosphoribosylaminoimidazolecarboxamide formyltransferase/IMP cyclohydrolase [candidate division GN15 bacterium]|nr:bifunctional phosphoribosylaminoimidazolecarboxamide formyltransferase/IMP cyclohydrolase [candidate division GN15 bacterium]
MAESKSDNKVQVTGPKIKRALLSVYNKTGLVELAQDLDLLGIHLISTGGTLRTLKESDVQAISVPAFTGSPEVMDGRVKTLHPKIHAGLLFRRDNPKDEEELIELETKAIDLVVVNLYPFEETVARAGATHAEIIENIDIGGPTMLRSAAKNYESVTVVVDPTDYGRLIEELKAHDGTTSLEFREQCAAKVFAMTAQYEKAISEYFSSRGSGEGGEDEGAGRRFPAVLTRSFSKQGKLRYGENPHQDAAVYGDPTFSGPSLLHGRVLAGKELSYNNYGDLDACLDMLLDFSEPFACVLKHANPCGAAIGETLAEAYKAAYESDPLSAFGSIIGLNQPVDIETAKLLHETHFVECMLAPKFSDEAFKLLKKKKARRILQLPGITKGRPAGETVLKYIRGGLLVQSADEHVPGKEQLKVVTKRKPTEQELKDLLFAWKVVKHTKSNAIVLAKDGATVGVGMGQTSRVDSGFMAVKRAGDRARGAVMASDAFYPMPDGVEVGTEAGVTAIIQPGGSKGDEDAIAAADKAGAAMVFTGVRHFKH